MTIIQLSRSFQYRTLTPDQGADLAWMMISSSLVLLMVPGIALFYSGVSSSQFALSQAWLPIMTTAIVGLEVSY